MDCMPHTVHLSAMEIDELYFNSSVSLVYINSSFHSYSSQLVHSKMKRKVPIVSIRAPITAPISQQHDDNAMGHDDEVNDEDLDPKFVLSEVLTAVEKVSISEVV